MSFHFHFARQRTQKNFITGQMATRETVDVADRLSGELKFLFRSVLIVLFVGQKRGSLLRVSPSSTPSHPWARANGKKEDGGSIGNTDRSKGKAMEGDQKQGKSGKPKGKKQKKCLEGEWYTVMTTRVEERRPFFLVFRCL
jgi:hypothetical protein